MKKRMSLLAGLMLVFSATTASALSISYELSGLLSGDYNGTPFSDAGFSLHVHANTANVKAISMFDTHDLYGVGTYTPLFNGPNLGSALAISGVGAFTFVAPTWLWDTQANALNPGILGFGTDSEADFLNVQNPFFETYHLVTAVLPLAVSVWRTGTVPFAVLTSPGGGQGLITLSGASGVTFEAAGAVPEPSTLALLGAGMCGLIFVRRKQAH
jgi:hypothetical protein